MENDACLMRPGGARKATLYIPYLAKPKRLLSMGWSPVATRIPGCSREGIPVMFNAFVFFAKLDNDQDYGLELEMTLL